MMDVLGLLTFAVYGAALPGGRGGAGVARAGDDLPEPRRWAEAGPPPTWPAVRLDPAQQEVILRDLPRIARLRGFRLHAALVDTDHVHVLLSCDGDDLPRLVQLVKGALARALTVAAGDRPAVTASGRPLPHHKWWARQHAFQPIADGGAMRRVLDRLAAHAARPGCLSLDYDPPEVTP